MLFNKSKKGKDNYQLDSLICRLKRNKANKMQEAKELIDSVQTYWLPEEKVVLREMREGPLQWGGNTKTLVVNEVSPVQWGYI